MITYTYLLHHFEFMVHSSRKSRGFIKTILLIVIALIILGFFGYNLRDIVDLPTVKENLLYVWGIILNLWNIFIVTPAVWLWDKIQGLLSRF